MPLAFRLFAPAALLALSAGCDDEPGKAAPPEAAAATTTAAAAPPPAVPEAPRAPDIVVEAARISIGADRVTMPAPGLADKLAALLTGRPAVAGQAVDVVAMRSAKPSQVLALADALSRAKATGATVKTEARDGTTQKLGLSFAKGVADCTTVAWITKDAAIDVWPASGATAKRVVRGLAGPDITLGTEAARKQASGCGSAEIVVGADDGLPWGVEFDLATSVLQAPGARASAAVLVGNPVPGRKLVLE